MLRPAPDIRPRGRRRRRAGREAARGEPQRAFVSASLRPYLLARAARLRAGAPGAGRGRRRPRRARPRRRPQGLPAPAAGALLPGARRAVRVAPGPAAAPGRACASRRSTPARLGEQRGGGGRERRRARREGARPRAAPARLRDREGRAGGPRRGRRPARGLRLRARRPGRGPRPVRHARRHPRRLPGHRGARGPLRAVRHRGRAADLLLDLHPALARGGRAGRDRARRRARPGAPRARRDRRDRARRATAPTWPSCCPWTASASCSTLRAGATALVAVAAEEELAPSLADLLAGRDHQLPRPGRAQPLRAPGPARRGARPRARSLRLSSISGDQPHEFRAQGADTAARSLREAEPELEKLVRSGYRTIVAWSRRGEAERARLQPGAGPRRLPRRRAGPGRAGRPVRPRRPPRGLPRPAAEAGRGARAPPVAAPPRRRARRARAGAARWPRSPTSAPATPVVHEDHGIARFTGFETKTVGGVTRDYLELEFRDGDRVFVPSDQLHKISRYVGADAGDPPLSKLGGKQWEQQKLRARRAAEALAGELINALRRAQAPRRPRLPARRRVADGVRAALPLPRDPRPARGDRAGAAPTWRRRARWTASSAATWATERPRWRCAPPSRRPRTASR